MAPVVCPIALLIGICVGLAGCDRVFGLERGPSCGDGVLSVDLDEDCDDGSDSSGDGCSSTCEIEPGFECSMEGEPCLPVLGVTRGPVGTRLEAAGSTNTGNPFAFECPPGEVVIGFTGHANEVGDNLGTVVVVCGSIAITTNGAAVVARGATSTEIGPSPSGPLITAVCAPDEIATGFTPFVNTYVSGFALDCQRVSHTGGALRLDAPSPIPFGPSTGSEEPNRRCSFREVVTEVAGTAGAAIDSLRVGCSVLSSVLCGDGVQVAPETCDDGNLTRRDGCDERCQRE